ncbi:hypothetical protein ANN_16528 [Periplaneta americana]|uniref:Uncharacterized protein n=1 Tax=Periplaneta americana TaxID=6978 RepID=A0ABQ8SQN2_PERAM|nr:hypothetical protein ANN_16528 [Periplaneta americana]
MSSAAAVKRLEALFRDVNLDHVHVQTALETRGCDVHATRRGSLGSVLHSRHRESVGPRRESMPALHVAGRRRDSLGAPLHPSAFPSTLRRDSLGSTGSLRRDSLAVPLRRDSQGSRRRFSTDSLDAGRRNSWDPGRRGSSSSSGGWDDPIWEESGTVKVPAVCMM